MRTVNLDAMGGVELAGYVDSLRADMAGEKASLVRASQRMGLMAYAALRAAAEQHRLAGRIDLAVTFERASNAVYDLEIAGGELAW